MTIGLILRALLIALLAALAAWLPLAVLVALDIDVGIIPSYSVLLLPLALFGSFALGLPIALLVYWLAGKSLTGSPKTVFMMANLAGVMMMLASFVLAGESGIRLLGIPSWIAANVYALLGWFWILKPGRVESQNIGGAGQ